MTGPIELVESGLVVYILTYSHRHGTDTGVYESEEAAVAGALAIVADYRDDFAVDRSVTNEEALADWICFTGGDEDICWSQASVMRIPEKRSK